MPAHRVLDDVSRLYALGGATIEDPGSGGTFDLAPCPYGGIATIASGTRKLPDNMPLNTKFSVYATGAVTITNVAGTTVKTLAANDIGHFTAKTATTWTGVVESVGNLLPSNTALPAGSVTIADAVGLTDQTTVEGALTAVTQEAQIIRVPMTTFVDADGDPLAKFADNASPNPGFNLADSEAFGIRWNNNATQNQPVLNSVLLPFSVTDAQVVTMHILASKTGATSGDATTFTVTAFVNADTALHDGGSNIGGASSAMTGAATAKTVQHKTLALTMPDVSYPTALTFTLTPTTGTLGTDDVIVEAIWFTFAN